MGQEIPKNYFEEDDWELPTDIELIDQVVKQYENRLRNNNWPEEDIDWLAVTLEEMLINAIAHGNLAISEKSENES